MRRSWKIIIFICISFVSIYLLYNVLTRIFIPKNQNMYGVETKVASEDCPVSFGGWSMEEELFNFIRAVLPPGKTILELGSGWVTGQFSKYYTLHSVEHNKMWINKYDSNYIYAPIKNKWYDPDILKKILPTEYDLILVDGPPGFGGTNRLGFYDNLDLFKTDIPIIFDDVDREAEYSLMMRVAQKLQRDVAVFTGNNKKFGIILLS